MNDYLTYTLMMMMDFWNSRVVHNNSARVCLTCPPSYRQDTIWKTHTLAHCGIQKTIDRIRLNWYWPGITAEIRLKFSAAKNINSEKVEIKPNYTAGEGYSVDAHGKLLLLTCCHKQSRETSGFKYSQTISHDGRTPSHWLIAQLQQLPKF